MKVIKWLTPFFALIAVLSFSSLLLQAVERRSILTI